MGPSGNRENAGYLFGERTWGATFDRCATRFAAAVEALRSNDESGDNPDKAWDGYLRELSAMRAAVENVVDYSPTTEGEADLRRAVAGRMMSLCHATDETWLESEAEKILPPEAALEAG